MHRPKSYAQHTAESGLEQCLLSASRAASSPELDRQTEYRLFKIDRLEADFDHARFPDFQMTRVCNLDWLDANDAKIGRRHDEHAIFSVDPAYSIFADPNFAIGHIEWKLETGERFDQIDLRRGSRFAPRRDQSRNAASCAMTDSVEVAILVAHYLVRQGFKRFGYVGYLRAPSNADGL